jgi:hypothetical protein
MFQPPFATILGGFADRFREGASAPPEGVKFA